MSSFFFQPDESVADDFLFPMSSGISYTSSPESDGEFCEPETPRNMSRQPSEEPSHMSRQYGSDPNLANLEENDAPNANRRIPPQTPVSKFSFLYNNLWANLHKVTVEFNVTFGP